MPGSPAARRPLGPSAPIAATREAPCSRQCVSHEPERPLPVRGGGDVVAQEDVGDAQLAECGRGARPVVTAVEPTQRIVQRRRGPGARQRQGVAGDPRPASQRVLDRGIDAPVGHGREHEDPTRRSGLRPVASPAHWSAPVARARVLLLHGEHGPGDREEAQDARDRLPRGPSRSAGATTRGRGAGRAGGRRAGSTPVAPRARATRGGWSTVPAGCRWRSRRRPGSGAMIGHPPDAAHRRARHGRSASSAATTTVATQPQREGGHRDEERPEEDQRGQGRGGRRSPSASAIPSTSGRVAARPVMSVAYDASQT